MAPRNALFRRFSTLLSIANTNALPRPEVKRLLLGLFVARVVQLAQLRAYIDPEEGGHGSRELYILFENFISRQFHQNYSPFDSLCISLSNGVANPSEPHRFFSLVMQLLRIT